MADSYKATFGVTVTPVESVEDQQANKHDVISGEIGKSVGGSGESYALGGFQGAANVQGYLNGTVNYVDAAVSAGGTALTDSVRASEMVFIKNTGFYFGTGVTSLGEASEDHVIVAIKLLAWASSSTAGYTNTSNNGEIQYIELAFLAPGEAIVLKLGATSKSVTQFGSVANDFLPLNYTDAALHVKTVVAAGTAASDGNAVEFLCLT